jgi:RHS repeat-associated protein
MKKTEYIARYAYDALGRRIRKVDAVASETTLYYYSDNWQVLAEYDGAGAPQAYYVFGNCIDEVLLMHRDAADHYYLHDHLYSPVALLDDAGTVAERYEYDAYGSVQILNTQFSILNSSQCGNPYAFTGRELDTLDAGALHHMHYRHRDYSPDLARFLQQDPHGINPAGGEVNAFSFENQYVNGLNIYQYAVSNPLYGGDAYGLWGPEVHYTNTERWARIVGYRKGNCSEIIAKACNEVDSGKTSPRPWGDYRYHFDTDSTGEIVMPGAREMMINQHLRRADVYLVMGSYVSVEKALKEIGTALHPLQDTFSHNEGHNASMPRYHAPKEWCRYLHGYPINKLSPWYGFCKAQEIINPNWDDPHRPDRIELWVADHSATRRATQELLHKYITNKWIECRCVLGKIW